MGLTAKAQPQHTWGQVCSTCPPGSHTVGDRDPLALPLRPGLGGRSCVIPGFTWKQGFCNTAVKHVCCAGGGADRGDMGLPRSHRSP